jgi:hypothetical protein
MPIAPLKAGRRADGAFARPRSRIEAATPLPLCTASGLPMLRMIVPARTSPQWISHVS